MINYNSWNQLKDCKIDLNSRSLENVKKIKDNIDNFVSQKCVKDLSITFSKLIRHSFQIIDKKIKQIIYDNFDYKDEDPKFKINYSWLSSLKYFFLFFY